MWPHDVKTISEGSSMHTTQTPAPWPSSSADTPPSVADCPPMPLPLGDVEDDDDEAPAAARAAIAALWALSAAATRFRIV